MKRFFTPIFAALLLAPLAAPHAADAPLPLLPTEGAVTYAPHPHLNGRVRRA